MAIDLLMPDLVLSMFLLAIAALIFWVWALVDAIRNPRPDSNMRLLWVILIAITNRVGAIIELAIGRNPKPAP